MTVFGDYDTNQTVQEEDTQRRLSLKTGVALTLSSIVLSSGHNAAPADETSTEPTPIKPHEISAHLGRFSLVHYSHEQPKITAQHAQPTSHLDAKIFYLPPILNRIGGCESGSGPNSPGDYNKPNPISTASGRYQFLDSTWNNYRGYSRAMYAPPHIQDVRAKIELKRHGTAPWYASKYCWG